MPKIIIIRDQNDLDAHCKNCVVPHGMKYSLDMNYIYYHTVNQKITEGIRVNRCFECVREFNVKIQLPTKTQSQSQINKQVTDIIGEFAYYDGDYEIGELRKFIFEDLAEQDPNYSDIARWAIRIELLKHKEKGLKK